jgi:ubiquinone/menaquinone biosynthesis C-methylase UbiE
MTEEPRPNYYRKAYFKNSKDVFIGENRIQQILRILEKHSGDTLLDVGCGSGEITTVIKETTNFSGVYGVDISEEAVSLACEKGIKAFKADLSISQLPFENDFFDIVICGEVIEHLFDTDFFEVYRVLKPKGVAVVTTPNRGAWYNRWALLFGFQPSISVSLQNPQVGKPFENAFKKQSSGGSEAHIRFFTRRALEKLLVIHRFRISATNGSYYAKPKSSHFILKLMFMFDRLFSHFPSLSTDLIVEITK